MIISTQYDMFDIVYLKHDTDFIERMITSMKIMPQTSIMYELSAGASASWHFEFEISKTPDLVKKLTSK